MHKTMPGNNSEYIEETRGRPETNYRIRAVRNQQETGNKKNQ